MNNLENFKKLNAKRKVLSAQLSDPAAVGFWRMVVDKYSEKAHFLYELFQNADDTKATYVRVILEEKGLYFIHNGAVQFTLTNPDEEGTGKPIGHLNSITSVGASTKVQSSSIGKFGIGFKSVFQYTSQPHIEDDSFCFTLNDYIVPELDERFPDVRMDGETLFYFPFVNPAVAISEITNTIKCLGNPLLFLNTLKAISWKSKVDGSAYEWKAKVLSSDNTIGKDNLKIKHEYIECSTPDVPKAFYHFLWTPVEHKEKGGLSCAVVFGADQDGYVQPVPSDKNTYCYFRLEESLNIPYFIHAPFLLTENRELIKKDDKWNDFLYELLAKLANSMFVLAANGVVKLASSNLFDYTPFDPKNNEVKESPFVREFVDTLRQPSMILADDGSYVSVANTLYSTDKQLKDVFTDDMLALLNQKWVDCKWTYGFLASIAATERKAYVDFLSKNRLIGNTCDIENILPLLDEKMLMAQSDEWLIGFYSFLSKHKGILEDDAVRRLPIVKCSDGIFRSIENEYGIIQLYKNKETEKDSSYSLFYLDSLFSNQSLDTFCDCAGIGEPSEFTFIEKVLLAKYANNKVDRSDIDQIVADLSRIAVYFSTLGFDVEGKENIVSLVSDVTFLPTINNRNEVSFSEPDLVYFDTKDLRAYFSAKEDVCFFDNAIMLKAPAMMREKLYYFLQSIGVSFSPRVVEVGVIPREEDLLYYGLQPKSLRVHDNGGQHIVDKQFDGFDKFLRNWTPESSIAFYKLLGKMMGECGSFAFRKQISGIYSYYEKSKQKQTEEVLYKTTANKQLFECAWLTSCDNKQVALSDVQHSNDLFDGCMDNDTDVYSLQLLGVQYDSSMKDLSPEHKKVILLMRRLKSIGVSTEDLEALIEGKAEIKYK